jgi:hypothetical protein
MGKEPIRRLEGGLFIDVANWAKPITSDLLNKCLVFPYLRNKEFMSDLESILVCSYHQNFVVESEANQDIHLSLLEKYPTYLQEEVLDSLKKGNDCCGYIRQEIARFERKIYSGSNYSKY